MSPYKVRKEILLNAPLSKVWDALTDSDSIKLYMFGSEVSSDWSPGSEIVFRGEHQGKQYVDKGKILSYEIEQKLEYTYLSSFSGLEDKPENYTIVTYILSGMDDGETTLTISQENLPGKEAAIHADSGWDHVLAELKNVVEA